MAIDGDERPHLCFLSQGRVFHAFKRVSWVTEVVDSSQATHASGAMAFDSCQIEARDNQIHMAYNLGSELDYALRTGTEWSLTVVDDSLDAGANISLALDMSGGPHIVYSASIEHTWMAEAKYAYQVSGEWHFDCVGDVPRANAALTMSRYSPRVVVSAERAFEYTLFYAAKDTAWTVEEVTKGGGSSVATTLDSKGVLHVVWASDGAVCHAVRSDGDWIISSYPHPAEPTWSMISCDVDDMGNVHIAHCYKAGLEHLIIRKNGGWDVEVVDPEATGPFPLYCLSLVVDSRGTPHIAYVAGDPLTPNTRRVRYAHRETQF
jgi:hypothetical protein